MSAMGSVITPTASPHQLAFTRPGISPRCARVRRQIRHSPNFLNTARGRPQLRQRLYLRTLNFGGCRHLMSRAFFGMLARSLADRQAEAAQKLQGFLVRPRSCHGRDVHTPDLVHLIVFYLLEDQLLANADIQATPAVERARGEALEVLDPRQTDIEQLVQELIHAL